MKQDIILLYNSLDNVFKEECGVKRSVSNIIFKIFAGCFICYVLFTLVSLQVEIVQKRRENAELKNKIENQEITNEEIQKILDESDKEELIRLFAENQGYAYHGEKIFIDEADN